MNDAQQLELVYHISNLLNKYIFRSISDDELTALYAWAYTDDANEELFLEMSDPNAILASLRSFFEITRSASISREPLFF